MKRIAAYIFVLAFLGNLSAQNDSVIYSFFAAGHTYGNPGNAQYGLHPPFVAYIPSLNNRPSIELGFLTGDVVNKKTAAYWDSAEVDINLLDMPIYIAAGNHDRGTEFVNRFGAYYYSFTHNNDLFVVLTPGLDAWNVEGDQLTFLTQTLDSNYQTVDNIFIFMHELIWWGPENIYQHIDINFEPHYPGSTNFDSVVKPLLQSYPNPFTLYAGDLGATKGVSSYMYHHFDNITLIGSGMGGGIKDNIVITHVYENSIQHELVALNGNDPHALGELTDFVMNLTEDSISEISVFPNPSKGFLNIKNADMLDLQIELNDFQGKRVHFQKVPPQTQIKINLTSISPGLYTVRALGKNKNFVWKVVFE